MMSRSSPGRFQILDEERIVAILAEECLGAWALAAENLGLIQDPILLAARLNAMTPRLRFGRCVFEDEFGNPARLHGIHAFLVPAVGNLQKVTAAPVASAAAGEGDKPAVVDVPIREGDQRLGGCDSATGAAFASGRARGRHRGGSRRKSCPTRRDLLPLRRSA